jgi:hypothetical protein
LTDDVVHGINRAGGRTWADLVFYAAIGAVAGGILAVIGWLVYQSFGYIPLWVPASMAASILWVPWMMERAKDDARLFVVVDGPMRLTEYRIGKRVPMEIEGRGITFKSSSGVDRVLLTSFNQDTMMAKGSAMEGMNQFDQVRDLSTVQKLSSALEAVLEEDRLTMQHVGIEVEKKNREIVDWALKLIYQGTVPTEITEALGIDEEPEIELELKSDLEGVLDD